MKYAWLVSTVGACQDRPRVVVRTKASARQWIRNEDPTLVFTSGNSSGCFSARTPGRRDSVCRYWIEKLPFIVDGDTDAR